MADSILQIFLNKQFIKHDKEEDVGKLKKAAAEVQKKLAKQKNKVISYTLVALDPNISDDEPVLDEVQTIIVKNWQTFLNSATKTKDKPVTYIRAVILQALNTLAKEENFAAIMMCPCPRSITADCVGSTTSIRYGSRGVSVMAGCDDSSIRSDLSSLILLMDS